MAIMADQEIGGWRGGTAKHLFQPKNTLDIQMVGRFIHDQYIRAQEQGPADRQSFAPAAGEVVDQGIVIRELSSTEETVHSIVFGNFVKILVAEGRHETCSNTLSGGKKVFLCQIANTDEFLQYNLATIGFLKTADDFQQRRFARTIWSDNADFFAAINHQIDIFKKILRPEGFSEGFASYQICHRKNKKNSKTIPPVTIGIHTAGKIFVQQ